MKELNKKIVTSILVITFIFSPIFAIPAGAQWIDISTAAKDYGLDGLAWMIVNQVINRMTASTVKWINSGFKGSPAYITDPASYYKNLGDKIAGQYIYNNPNLNFLCGDMSVKVKLALSRSYNYNNDPMNWRCSLTKVVDNLDDFMNDFEKGGWDGFFELTQRQQNNPIGIYLQASDAMYDAIESRTDLTREELSQGKGFFSQKKCIKWGPGVEVVDYQTGQTVPGEPVCLKEETTTPGDVISSQLNKQLGLGNDRLSISDEINELVSSLLNQLIGQVMGGIGGLRGASESDSSNDNKILTEQLAIPTEEEKVDYFKRPQNTSILDVPLPGTTPLTPKDTDCENIDRTTLVRMALAKIDADPLLEDSDLDQVILDLDCGPVGINLAPSAINSTNQTPQTTNTQTNTVLTTTPLTTTNQTSPTSKTVTTPLLTQTQTTESDSYVGVYFWASPLNNSGTDIITTGATLTKNLGVEKIRIALSSKSDLDYGKGGCINNFSLKNLAQREDFASIFSDPKFTTIMITAIDGVSFPDCSTKNYLNQNFVIQNKQQISQEYKDLAGYLKNFPTKKFIISNWEGDNDVYCGAAYGASSVTCPNYSNSLAGFKEWVTAYSDGIRSAGAGNVFSAVEFNIARYLKNNNMPSVLYDVIPATNTDYFSYSSYESINPIITLNDGGSQLSSDLVLIKNTISNAGKNQNNLIIGEFGFSSSNRELVKSSLETAMNVFGENSIKDYFVWNLSDSGGYFGLYDANSQLTSSGQYVCNVAGGLNCI